MVAVVVVVVVEVGQLLEIAKGSPQRWRQTEKIRVGGPYDWESMGVVGCPTQHTKA